MGVAGAVVSRSGRDFGRRRDDRRRINPGTRSPAGANGSQLHAQEATGRAVSTKIHTKTGTGQKISSSSCNPDSGGCNGRDGTLLIGFGRWTMVGQGSRKRGCRPATPVNRKKIVHLLSEKGRHIVGSHSSERVCCDVEAVFLTKVDFRDGSIVSLCIRRPDNRL